MCEDQKVDEEELKVSEDDDSQIPVGVSADDGSMHPASWGPLYRCLQIENISASAKGTSEDGGD